MPVSQINIQGIEHSRKRKLVSMCSCWNNDHLKFKKQKRPVWLEQSKWGWFSMRSNERAKQRPDHEGSKRRHIPARIAKVWKESRMQ